jgi:hypothetical protein
MSKLFSISNPIHKQTIENQGCSMNLDGLQPVTGYMVAVKDKEQKINILDFNAGHIDSFIRANLSDLHNRNYFVGTWVNDDIVYLDLSLNMPHKEGALIWGKANGQICIWDVEKKVEIYRLEEM